MSTIPGNALQDKLSRLHNANKRPAYGIIHKAFGTIIEVYDSTTLASRQLPGELAEIYMKNPGRLFGRIKLANGKSYYLPFKESAEMIYSTYGDSSFIEGRIGYIVYYDHNIHYGELMISGDNKTALQDTEVSTTIYDIGEIFST